MDGRADQTPQFPRRALAGLVLGFAAATLVWNLAPYGPADVLPTLAAVPKTPPIDWPERAPGEFRVVAVGVSPTAGYPYAPLGKLSFATLCAAGLDAARPAGAPSVRVAPLAMDSADAPTIVGLCRLALAHAPDLLVVEIGANEVAARIFGEQPLVGDGWRGLVADRATRARLVLDAWLSSPPSSADALDGSPLQAWFDRIYAARPGVPLVGGLPVSAADVAAIADRVARAVDAIAAEAAAAGVEVVLWPSPYDLPRAWPLGMVAADPVVDAAVATLRAGGMPTEAEVAALRDRVGRADVQHLLGRIASEAGDDAAARAHFERARDLDPAPWHVVGAVRDALAARAAAHPHLTFVDLADDLGGGFVDVQHPAVEGQRELALRLRDLLERRGVPVGGRDAFVAGVDARVAAVLSPRERAIAEGRGARIDVLTHMILGAVRDALPSFGPALAGFRLEVAAADDPNWQQWALIAVIAAAAVRGDLEALSEGTPEERAARLVALARELWALDDEARQRWVYTRAGIGR